MIIAIGTTRLPKVEGIQEWLSTCPYFENPDSIEYILEKVSSGISDMPLSMEETMKWAQNRAQNLKKIWIMADFYIWIEWGTTAIWNKKYIGWIVYIENSLWKWHYGFSPMIEVPEYIEHKIYKDGYELWPLMWEISGRLDIRSEEWSMWAWSNDMLSRKDEFKSAFQAAISPFFNDYYKM